METLYFRAMGSDINVIWDSPAPVADTWAQLPQQFEIWEQALSRFRPDSELMRLNKQAGHPVVVSQTIATLLEVAQHGAIVSDGLVVPTVLERLAAAGYTRSFENMAASFTGDIRRSATVPLVSALNYDPIRRTVTMPLGMQLDFGGIAKGWAADTIARQWGGQSPILIDVGGDIAVSGPRYDDSPWPIAVANPLTNEFGAPLALLMVNGGGVATSGRDYRRWTYNGRAMHHIIDPRTGEPATSDILAATVVAPSAVDAEIAAKVVLIRGYEEGLAWIEQHPDMAALTVGETGEIYTSSRWSDYCWTGA